MLYHLLYPLSETVSAFNVFRYLTFRSVGAALTALLIAFLLGPILIQTMRDRKVGQTIREDTPERHQAKSGTPTFGGLLILLALLLSTLLWSEWSSPYLWIVLGVTLGFGLVGFADDYEKAIKKNSQGIRARTKLGFQLVIAGTAAAAIWSLPGFDAEISVPFFKDFHPNIGVLYLPLIVFVVVGTSNAVNLPDGLAGLALGPVRTTSVVIGAFSYAVGNSGISAYLGTKYIAGAGTLSIVCASMIGAGLGFLWFNTYPAAVFMGDTGALAIGGALGTIACIIRQEVVLAVAGGIFVGETVSVIVQVISFKLTGRRVFRMAPIHHHYEQLGWPEPQIIVRFWIISVILALVALSLLKLR